MLFFDDFSSCFLSHKQIASSFSQFIGAFSVSGATGHFLVDGSRAVNIQPASHPIKIILTNGKVTMSTHTCNLDIPWLSDVISEAHIVPGLSHSSLILTRKFYNAGSKVIFDKNECSVKYQGKLVLTGGRYLLTELQQLLINPTTIYNPQLLLSHLDLHVPANTLNVEAQATHCTCNVYIIPYK